MTHRRIPIAVALLMLVAQSLGGLWPADAQEMEADQNGPVLLRLKYSTFDPLQGEPAMSEALELEAYPGRGEGAYLVQFRGPIKEAWKEQVRTLGGRVLDYVPDYAFLVWMDGAIRDQVASLETVRWVGLYQPAYKLSPGLDRSQGVYRVALFEGADLAAVETRLESLNTPTKKVPGERFTLLLSGEELDTVAAWPEVLWIENRPVYRVTNDVAGGILQAPAVWLSGLTGSGTTITVADTGLDSGVDNPGVGGDMHPDFDNRVAQIKSWAVQDDGCGGCCYANIGADDGPADVYSGHGTHVLGSAGGNGAASGGQFKGLAYGATLIFQAVEQWTEYTVACNGGSGFDVSGLPLDLQYLFQQAYGWGSRIHSDSWSASVGGEYTADSQAVDRFIWDHPNMVILFSAGNFGVDGNQNGYVDEGSMGSPATAKNAITVGASDNERRSGGYSPGGPCWTWNGCWRPPYDYFPANPTKDDRISDRRGEMAGFSGRGPTDDGRIKPDVVAPGTNILSTRSRQPGVGDGWGSYLDNPNYMYLGGTSMSTPLVAGAAALVREYYLIERGHTPSAALVKATLINAAVDMPGYGNTSQEAGKPIPNHHEGWGRVDVAAATSGMRQFRDGDAIARNGDVKSYPPYQVGSSRTPLKITLVWSDYPGTLPAGGLMNDLDLRVTAPGGETYQGNRFSNGWSVPGGSGDRFNNVESVYIQEPAMGQWIVRVYGYNISHAPQPFALVVTGQFGLLEPVYLPLVARYRAPDGVKALENGDFEEGATGWSQHSVHGWPLILRSAFPTGVTPHDGDWAAWLGGDDGELTSYLEQEVTVLEGKHHLHYWHWIDSEELCYYYDVARILVNGEVVDTYELCQGRNTGGWVEYSVDLTHYAGQTVVLRIEVETDSSLLSSLYVDGVSMEANGVPGESTSQPVPGPAPSGPGKLKDIPGSGGVKSP